MAASPEYKVYDADGNYQAALKDPAAAASLIGFYGDGATIRYRHSQVVWTEGKEAYPASESYDMASEVMRARIKKKKTDA